MERIEAIEAMADYDNCIDVQALRKPQNRIVSKGLDGVIDV